MQKVGEGTVDLAVLLCLPDMILIVAGNSELSEFGRIGRLESLRRRLFRTDLDSLCATTLLCKKILTFCFCSQLQQAQRYAKLLAPSKKVSYQTIIVDLFLPMSQVGNSKWISTCHPSKNLSVSERHAKAMDIKFGSKKGIGAVHGQVDWLPSGTTPTGFCATLFFQWFFV
jgi:hypothetical protein